jgi:hypothetical protein
VELRAGSSHADKTGAAAAGRTGVHQVHQFDKGTRRVLDLCMTIT